MEAARLILIAALVAASSTAHADPRVPVPDDTLRAVGDRVVWLELDNAPAITGQLLDFSAASVTVALATTHEAVTIARDHVERLVVVDRSCATLRVAARPGEAGACDPPPPPPPRLRMIGVQFGIPGTLVVDAEHDLVHGFASMNALLPILTASGNSRWVVASVGAGVAVPLPGGSRWKVDVFGQVLPLHFTSFYTYLGFGIGAGLHYTAPSGFTFGVSLPVLGFATRLGSSPYGYDARFTYNDSLAYYYVAGLTGMPLVTMGYRFATGCPRSMANSRSTSAENAASSK